MAVVIATPLALAAEVHAADDADDGDPERVGWRLATVGPTRGRVVTVGTTAAPARDLTFEVAWLTQALTPTSQDCVERLVERARTDSWTHEGCLVACLEREAPGRDRHGGGIGCPTTTPPGGCRTLQRRDHHRSPDRPGRPPRRSHRPRGPRLRHGPPTRSRHTDPDRRMTHRRGHVRPSMTASSTTSV